MTDWRPTVLLTDYNSYLWPLDPYVQIFSFQIHTVLTLFSMHLFIWELTSHWRVTEALLCLWLHQTQSMVTYCCILTTEAERAHVGISSRWSDQKSVSSESVTEFWSHFPRLTNFGWGGTQNSSLRISSAPLWQSGHSRWHFQEYSVQHGPKHRTEVRCTDVYCMNDDTGTHTTERHHTQ